MFLFSNIWWFITEQIEKICFQWKKCPTNSDIVIPWQGNTAPITNKKLLQFSIFKLRPRWALCVQLITSYYRKYVPYPQIKGRNSPFICPIQPVRPFHSKLHISGQQINLTFLDFLQTWQSLCWLIKYAVS